jgi:galactose mutarotase-like enzyme
MAIGGKIRSNYQDDLVAAVPRCATGNDMGFEHHVFEQEGHRLQEVTDGESGFRILVDNIGAELVSISRRTVNGDWDGYLHRDGEIKPAERGWQNHATVMGYYLHRIKGERTFYEGEEIRGGNHSFLRHKTFTDPKFSSSSDRAALEYSLSSDQIERTEYPRKVSFAINYALRGNTVEVTFVFQNEETQRPSHVSFGLHPGFAVSSVEQARIILPKGKYRRYLAPDNFLSGETVEFEASGGTMPIKPFELPGSFLLEAIDVESYDVRLQDYGRHRQVELDLSEAPYFTIWSDLGPFVCIEPCWGLPDHQNQRPFEQKLGIQAIPPKDTLTRRFSMRFS